MASSPTSAPPAAASAPKRPAPRETVLYRAPDVVICTMGKVGSTSISTTLREAGVTCFDIHHLDPVKLGALLVRHFQNRDHGIVPPNIVESIGARNALVRRRNRDEITRIITCVREPVARNISAVFQNLPIRHKDDPATVERIVSEYNVASADDWFTQDFEPATGLDLLGMAHDRSAGVFRYANRLFDVLLLKLETTDEVKSQALSEFLDRPITIQRMNDSRDKWYYGMYTEQIKRARLIPGAFARRCLDLRYFRAFYSDKEIEETARRHGIVL